MIDVRTPRGLLALLSELGQGDEKTEKQKERLEKQLRKMSKKNRWLTADEAADYLRISRKTLDRWYASGKLPAEAKVVFTEGKGGAKGWDPFVLESWAENQKKKPAG